MTKILMYSVRPDELTAIKQHAEANNMQIDTTDDLLDGSTVGLAQGYDGIVIQQRAPIGDDTVYAKLASYGIKQLTTRTAGLDTINIPAAHAAGLVVTNVPAYSPRSVAENALMSIFRILRKSAVVDHRVAQNNYTWAGLQAKEIHSATIGIIGAGRIGGTLAELLHLLGAEVLAFDVKERDELRGTVTYTTKEDLLKRSDVVSLHVDLNESSAGLIGAAEFALMKPDAGIVNASRGPVVDTAALVDALRSKQIAAA
jgi:D-lactate dehydrogenase